MPAKNPNEETRNFGNSFVRRKSKSSITMPPEESVAKSKNIKDPTPGAVGTTNIPFFPGSFELIKLELHSAHKEGGGFIDLRNTYSEINIYEDMFSPALQMDIRILDGQGFEEWLPIIGEETIAIEVKTSNLPDMTEEDIQKVEKPPQTTAAEGPPPPPGPFADASNSGIINLLFSVYKLSDRMPQDQVHGMISYTLHCVSKEYVDSCQQKVQRTTLDPITKEPRKISNTVRSLYKEFFKWSEKKIFIEPTKNLTNIITPNLPPFETFSFLASRAVSAGQHAVGSNFVFFETTTGYHFVSIETLMAGGGSGYQNPPDYPVGTSPQEGQYTMKPTRSKETYTIWPKRYKDPDTSPIQQAAMEEIAIDHFEVISNFDVLENLTKGMYANRLLTHDIVRMKYDISDFNYIEPAEQRTKTVRKSDGSTEEWPKVLSAQDKKNFGDGFAHLDQGDLCTWQQHALGAPEAHINFYPTSLGHDSIPHFKNGVGIKTVKHGAITGPLNIVPNRVEQWMQQRTAQQQQLNNIKILIRAPGRSCRMVGDIIDFKFPSGDKKERTGKTSMADHKYLSGKYLITKLRHNFTKEKYTIDFEAVKDSLKEQMPGVITGAGSSAIMDDGSIKMSEDGSRVIGGF